MIEQIEKPLVVIDALRTHFGKGKRTVRAVDGVDLVIPRGKTVALVGESGSGKTTVGRTMLKLIPATGGKVLFDGYDIFSTSGRDLKKLRQRMQMIFQDPAASLNPRMTVEKIIAEPLKVHFSMSRTQRRQRVAELLQQVELSPRYMNRYPHEFSGG
ncbi:MAG: ATP-binding cassette domain-containing protein, partial [Phycisphaerae bacterium]|nr:ATP-binding cassette domain-containing protein [Phycisphaerae bacterium]